MDWRRLADKISNPHDFKKTLNWRLSTSGKEVKTPDSAGICGFEKNEA
jgi:hypothetical protein